MSKVRRVDLHPDEWLRGTATLPCELRGAYITICCLIYSQGGPIEDNDTDLAYLMKMNPRRWRAARDQLVDRGKIEIRDGFITNSRCEIELKTARTRTERASTAARTRFEAHADQDGVSVENSDLAVLQASQPRDANQEPRTKNQEPRTQAVGGAEGAPPPKPVIRGSRLPADWALTPELRTIGEAARSRHQLPPVDLDLEAENFRDYWHARAGPQAIHLDWVATWRTWVRKAREPPGQHLTTFPQQRDAHGHANSQARPVDHAARAAILVARREADLRGDFRLSDRADADPALPAVPRRG